MLAVTCREHRRVEWLTIKGVGHAVVVVILIETIRQPCAVRIGESLINLAVTIIILTITHFIVVIGRLLTNQSSGSADNSPLDTHISIVAVTIIIEGWLTEAIWRDGVTVIILAVTQLGILGVRIIAD